MCIEQKISCFLIRACKFEYFLLCEDSTLAKTHSVGGFCKIVGVDWQKIASELSKKQIFSYDFCKQEGFDAFIEPPQFLVIRETESIAKPDWDSDCVHIDSWDRLLCRGYAQLRNNVAHGNKSHKSAAFTQGRTEDYISAAHKLMDFVVYKLFGYESWETSITFKN